MFCHLFVSIYVGGCVCHCTQKTKADISALPHHFLSNYLETGSLTEIGNRLGARTPPVNLLFLFPASMALEFQACKSSWNVNSGHLLLWIVEGFVQGGVDNELYCFWKLRTHQNNQWACKNTSILSIHNMLSHINIVLKINYTWYISASGKGWMTV